MRIKIYKIYIILLMAALASSCATSSSTIIDSVTLKRINTKPSKVFILSHMDFALPDSFKDGYVRSMTHEFAKLGATAVSAQVTGLELDKDVYTKQMEDIQPDLVLIVRTDINAVLGDTYSGKIFLSLLDYRDNTEVWKLQQTFKISYLTNLRLYRNGSGFAREAYQKLLTDRVFIPESKKKADKLAQERTSKLSPNLKSSDI